VLSLEATLMVIGLNQRTSPVAVRERFWIGEDRRYDVLTQVSRSEGIGEALILATGNRTEFVLWAEDPTAAANSILRLLTGQYGLKISDWEHFYRLLDDAALLHLFRVITGLDALSIGEPEITGQFRAAWRQAQKTGTAGPCLDAVMAKALDVAQRVATETSLPTFTQPVPRAATELASEIFGSVEGRSVLLLGCCRTSELSALALKEKGAGRLCVIDRGPEKAKQLAATLNAGFASLDDRWQEMLRADIVISASGCPHTIFPRQEVEAIAAQRKRRPLLLIDVAMPRDVDPVARKIPGIHLYDLDDLQKLANHEAAERQAAAADAQRILVAEAQGFRHHLAAQRVVPTAMAVQKWLDQICRQELDSFRTDRGPFSKDQDAILSAMIPRLTKRIAGSLARELKEVPEKVEQEQMTAAVLRLFHVEPPETSFAGSSSARSD
jgi:glutamyl-tRNA reductase